LQDFIQFVSSELRKSFQVELQRHKIFFAKLAIFVTKEYNSGKIKPNPVL